MSIKKLETQVGLDLYEWYAIENEGNPWNFSYRHYVANYTKLEGIINGKRVKITSFYSNEQRGWIRGWIDDYDLEARDAQCIFSKYEDKAIKHKSTGNYTELAKIADKLDKEHEEKMLKEDEKRKKEKRKEEKENHIENQGKRKKILKGIIC